jgi:hypothetical protein
MTAVSARLTIRLIMIAIGAEREVRMREESRAVCLTESDSKQTEVENRKSNGSKLQNDSEQGSGKEDGEEHEKAASDDPSVHT